MAVEDSVTGVESARRAGMRVLGVGPRPAVAGADQADLLLRRPVKIRRCSPAAVSLKRGNPHQCNVTVFADGQVARALCGSGICSRVAVLAGSGALRPGGRPAGGDRRESAPSGCPKGERKEAEPGSEEAYRAPAGCRIQACGSEGAARGVEDHVAADDPAARVGPTRADHALIGHMDGLHGQVDQEVVSMKTPSSFYAF